MFKMADNSAKCERKIPKRLIHEFVEAKPKHFKKITTTDRNICSVEIKEVDKARNVVKVHGYNIRASEDKITSALTSSKLCQIYPLFVFSVNQFCLCALEF